MTNIKYQDGPIDNDIYEVFSNGIHFPSMVFKNDEGNDNPFTASNQDQIITKDFYSADDNPYIQLRVIQVIPLTTDLEQDLTRSNLLLLFINNRKNEIDSFVYIGQVTVDRDFKLSTMQDLIDQVALEDFIEEEYQEILKISYGKFWKDKNSEKRREFTLGKGSALQIVNQPIIFSKTFEKSEGGFDLFQSGEPIYEYGSPYIWTIDGENYFVYGKIENDIRKYYMYSLVNAEIIYELEDQTELPLGDRNYFVEIYENLDESDDELVSVSFSLTVKNKNLCFQDYEIKDINEQVLDTWSILYVPYINNEQIEVCIVAILKSTNRQIDNDAIPTFTMSINSNKLELYDIKSDSNYFVAANSNLTKPLTLENFRNLDSTISLNTPELIGNNTDDITENEKNYLTWPFYNEYSSIIKYDDLYWGYFKNNKWYWYTVKHEIKKENGDIFYRYNLDLKECLNNDREPVEVGNFPGDHNNYNFYFLLDKNNTNQIENPKNNGDFILKAKNILKIGVINNTTQGSIMVVIPKTISNFDFYSESFQLVNNTLVVPIPENHTYSDKKFIFTPLKNSYYIDSKNNIKQFSKDNIEPTILKNQIMQPLDKTGFLAFGGYLHGQLPQLGANWTNSSDLTVEQLRYIEPNSTIEYIESDNTYEISFNTLLLFTESNITDLSNDNTYSYNLFYENEETYIDLSSLIKLVTITVSDTVITDAEILKRIPYSLVEEVFIKDGATITGINNINSNCLDIPNQINGTTVNSLYTQEINTFRQAILPINNLFILNSGFSFNIKKLRTYPTQLENLKSNTVQILQQDIPDNNKLYISSGFFENSKIKDYQSITDYYKNIWYGEKAFLNSNLSIFNIQNNDIYCGSINKVIQSTSFLKDFKIAGQSSYVLDNGLLRKNNGIESITYNYLQKNNIINNNTVYLSNLISSDSNKNKINDFAFYSSNQMIHTLVIDTEDLELSDYALNFGDNGKLETVHFIKNAYPISPKSDWLILSGKKKVIIDNNVGVNKLALANINCEDLEIRNVEEPMNFSYGQGQFKLTKLTINSDNGEFKYVYPNAISDLTAKISGYFSQETLGQLFGDNIGLKSFDISQGLISENQNDNIVYVNNQVIPANKIGGDFTQLENLTCTIGQYEQVKKCQSNALNRLTIISSPYNNFNDLNVGETWLQVGFFPNLQVLKIKRTEEIEGKNFGPLLNNESFKGIESLKNIYLPLEMFSAFTTTENEGLITFTYIPLSTYVQDPTIGDTWIDNMTFYSRTPKNIYIYVDQSFFEGNNIEARKSLLKTAINQRVNLFPYNSNIYIIDNKELKREWLMSYEGRRVFPEDQIINKLELWEVNEIERRLKLDTNTSNGGNNNG